MSRFLASGLFALIPATVCFAETIKVGFEPMPPLVNEDGTGYVVTMLQEIEKTTDLKFSIEIMPYSRAKTNLKEKLVDMLGMTPHKSETKDFYEFASDIDWSVASKVDMFSIKDANLGKDKLKSMKKIGVPRGNEEFFSEMYGIPLGNFQAGQLDSLFKMVVSDRIDVVLFERASSVSTIQKQKLTGIKYQNVDTLQASMAVRTDKEGLALKSKLESAIKKIDTASIFKDYMKYVDMPDSSEVKP